MSLSVVMYASEVSLEIQVRCLLAPVTHPSCAVVTSVKSFVENLPSLCGMLCKSVLMFTRMMITNECQLFSYPTSHQTSEA